MAAEHGSELPPHIEALVEAIEDAEDIRAARAALADPGPDIPLEDVLAEYADDLEFDDTP